jgi:hypothetical protein
VNDDDIKALTKLIDRSVKPYAGGGIIGGIFALIDIIANGTGHGIGVSPYFAGGIGVAIGSPIVGWLTSMEANKAVKRRAVNLRELIVTNFSDENPTKDQLLRKLDARLTEYDRKVILRPQFAQDIDRVLDEYHTAFDEMR